MTWNVKSEDDNLMLGRTAYKCNLKWSNKSIAAFIASVVPCSCVIVGNIGTATAPLEIITHKMGLFFQSTLYTFRDNVYHGRCILNHRLFEALISVKAGTLASFSILILYVHTTLR